MRDCVRRSRSPEAVVDRADDAAQVAAPADAREADARRVDLRAGTQERMAAHDRRDRMVRPLVPYGLADLRDGTAPAGWSRPFMARMRLAVALALRDGAARVHRDRGVPAVVPRLHPLHLAVRTRAFGKAPPREDARRLALQRLAFDEDRLDARDSPVVVRARDRNGERARRLVQRLDVPYRAASARQLAIRYDGHIRRTCGDYGHAADYRMGRKQFQCHRHSSFCLTCANPSLSGR